MFTVDQGNGCCQQRDLLWRGTRRHIEDDQRTVTVRVLRPLQRRHRHRADGKRSHSASTSFNGFSANIPAIATMTGVSRITVSTLRERWDSLRRSISLPADGRRSHIPVGEGPSGCGSTRRTCHALPGPDGFQRRRERQTRVGGIQRMGAQCARGTLSAISTADGRKRHARAGIFRHLGAVHPGVQTGEV